MEQPHQSTHPQNRALRRKDAPTMWPTAHPWT
jgi:hypothetical protein